MEKQTRCPWFLFLCVAMLLGGIIAIITVITSSTTVYAYEEQLTLGADLSYVSAPGAAPNVHGVGLGLDMTWGLGEAWALGGRLGYAMHPANAHVLSFAVEVVYVLDIVDFVPFAGVGVGVFGTFSSADTERAFDMGPHVLVGLDWLQSRELLFGVDMRVHWLPLPLKQGTLPDHVYVQLGVRASWIVDLF